MDTHLKIILHLKKQQKKFRRKQRPTQGFEWQSCLNKVGIYLFANKAWGGGTPKILIDILWCQNFMRLKFQSYEFYIWGLLKAEFVDFFEN